MRLCVLDLDGSVAAQPLFLDRHAAGAATFVEMRDLAPQLRLTGSRRAMEAFLGRLPPPGRDADMFFYGSGDFHHLTAGLLRRIDEPVTVIHLDNHPDWLTFPPTFNCGGWVSRALRLPHVRKVITIGPCSPDLAAPDLKGANLRALADGALEVYPWRHPPSRLLSARMSAASGWTGNTIRWHNVGGAAWESFLSDLPRRIPTRAVWITLDKDVFCEPDALTNWDQGEMSLVHALVLLRRIATRHRIVGMDVCGDYSPARFRDPWRRFLAFTDHDCRRVRAADHAVINARANAQLLRLMEDIFRERPE